MITQSSFPVETSGKSVHALYKSDQSATRVDIALLASSLFLQRFSLPFGQFLLPLDLIPVVLIVFHQFLSGKLLIQYDRLMWFLVLGLTATITLLLNAKSGFASYLLFIVLCALFTFTKPSSPELYRRTLQAFQSLMLLLSCLAVAQFGAQFVVDGRKLIMFFGMIPDFLLGFFNRGGENTIHPLTYGSSILKSNGLFLAEPSTLSIMTALGILIEVLEFRRSRHLVLMTLGLLVSYSGTGVLILFLFLPLASIRYGKAALATLLIVIATIALFATGIIHSSAFLGRIGEFQDPNASGFERYVAPIQLAVQHFDTASLPVLLMGSGPGTTKAFKGVWYEAMPITWYKLFYDYGVIGLFIFICFFSACFRKTRCPVIAAAALVEYVFFQGSIYTSSLAVLIVVLCTLSGVSVESRDLELASGRFRSLETGFHQRTYR